MKKMRLTSRQEQIIDLVKENQPITSEQIASKLNVTRATLRPDLAILTMSGILDAKPKVGYIYANKPSYSVLYDYLNKTKVKKVMTKAVLLNEDEWVYDGIVTLFLNDTGTLYVENDGKLVGVVSRKDFLKIAMGGSDLHKVPLGIIMTRMPNIVYTTKDESVYEAAKKIIEHQIDSLPVIDKESDKDGFHVIGKISKTNITKILIDLCEEK
ncbi:helix-turn-helix transcriptional regulator [Oceanirhabdus sp. W0125-5]|uniref:helix-turn-helix transcriptional regulator n=1 Tax=Oceanirhabdus sp. W0125-5 TaxID=2999116 RepID=UPI0022F33D92|nr:helix-turn-helix transcriptional regulator [Oceanirhabdus sp. W0125-5]WBW95765.1 helix-turn-helix transcriptional regulator [Oceanirhabdus sp. W0125-5]